MKTYPKLLEEFEKQKEKIISKMENRIQEVLRLLTESGFDATKYEIGMGVQYIGDSNYPKAGNLEYEVYQIVMTHSDYYSYYNATYEINAGQIRDSKADGETYPLFPYLTKRQFNWIWEFNDLAHFIQYGEE